MCEIFFVDTIYGGIKCIVLMQGCIVKALNEIIFVKWCSRHECTILRSFYYIKEEIKFVIVLNTRTIRQDKMIFCNFFSIQINMRWSLWIIKTGNQLICRNDSSIFQLLEKGHNNIAIIAIY